MKCPLVELTVAVILESNKKQKITRSWGRRLLKWTEALKPSRQWW